jgi:hypothetical protein
LMKYCVILPLMLSFMKPLKIFIGTQIYADKRR